MTGTDTGVGKTTVAAALARLALVRGKVPTPYKPVETGCAPDPEDARLLWEAARPPATVAEVCPFALSLPAAPAAAARAAGLELDVTDLVRRGLALAARGDFLIVEGAGGLLVPYGHGSTNADLAASFGLPVVVVARTALGTINHVALTLAELERRQLTLAGLILVRTTHEVAPHEDTNGELIASLTGVRPLGTLPYLSPFDLARPDALGTALAAALSPAALDLLLPPG